MPRLVCISDTHELHRELEVPDGDILIHSGDFTYVGEPDAIKDFVEWLVALPHKHKVFIAGNHEVTLDHTLSEGHIARRFGMVGDFKALREYVALPREGVHYLLDREVEVDGLRIYGAPWQPSFGGWGFNRDRGRHISTKWDSIPAGVDVLVTHGPPYGKGDLLDTNERVGCAALLYQVQERVRPRVHVFGHIHHSYGVYSEEGITYINASSCGEDYKIRNKPIVYDL